MREPHIWGAQVKRFGNLDGGEVRVRILASSVAYTDVTIRRHLYPWCSAGCRSSSS